MVAFDNVVYLNEKRYRVTGPPVETVASQYPPKELIGREPTANDHNLTSTLALGDCSGGWGRFRYEPGGDTDRFWFSTVDTRWPGRICTLPAQRNTTAPHSFTSMTEGGWARCLHATTGVELPLCYGGTRFMVPSANLTRTGFGTGWSSAYTDQSLSTGGIVYITDSVPFQGGQLFACADTNRAPIAYRYCASDITTTPTISTSVPLAMKFAVIGETVYMAGHKSGDAKTIYISFSTAPFSSSTWTDLCSFQRDDKLKDIRFFVQGWDGNGQACFYLGTGRSIFRISVVRGVAERIFTLPHQYDAANGFHVRGVLWERNQNLYVANGQSIWEFDGGSWKDISPYANGDGMPAGTTATFADYYVANTPFVDLIPRGYELIAVQAGGTSPSSIHQLVLAYREGTWHTLCSRGFLDGGLGIALADGVIWRSGSSGAGTSTTGLAGIYDADTAQPPFVRTTTELSSTFDPGYIIFPWYDGGFPTDPKNLLSAVFFGGPATFDAGYASNDVYNSGALFDPASQSLPTLGSTLDLPLASGAGVSVKTFRVAVTLNGPNGTDFGMIDSIGVKYRLTPRPLWGWRLDIDLTDDFEGRSPATMYAELRALPGNGTLLPFYYDGTGTAAAPKVVEMTGLSFVATTTPLDPRTVATVTVIEPRPNAGFV